MDIGALASQVGQMLLRRQSKIVLAESCTGGWVAQAITAVPGSSKWFDRAYVVYSNAAKQEMLQIPAAMIQQYGAVSEQVVCAMAKQAVKLSAADVSIAITGVAGPDGGTPAKPVGTVWFAWLGKDFPMRIACRLFFGERNSIRLQAVKYALDELFEILNTLD